MVEQTATDEALSSLRTQMERKQTQIVEEATTLVADAQQKAADATAARIQSDKTAIQNGIAAATSAADAAEMRLAEASEKGDHSGIAKATRELNEAISTKTTYENRKINLETWEKNQRERAERAKVDAPQRQQQQQEQPGRTFTPATKAWLDKNGVDGQTDNAKFLKAQSGHFDALAAGLTVDTPEYFAHLDKTWGGAAATADSPLSQAADVVEVDLSKPAAQQQQDRREPPPVALAPSRPNPVISPPSNQVVGGKVTLTAGEVEAAKVSNPELWRKDQNAAILEYAQNKAKLIQEGRL